jgi:c-di-GMP-binding flagellar brake protein YcgR
MMKERRRYQRRHVVIPVMLSFQNRYIKVQNLRAEVADLGLGGAFVRCLDEGILERLDPERCSKVTISFTEGSNGAGEVEGRVVWIKNDGEGRGFGLAFERISRETKTRLGCFSHAVII